jgi:DNA-directed RNA polymerase subunit M/transcription elongation factor TFIIS
MDAFRFESYMRLYNHTDNARITTTLEASAWHNACRSGHLHGIPVWQYSTGTTLFETDRTEAHAREHMSAYSDAIEALLESMKIPELKAKLLSGQEIQDNDAHGTEYARWHEKYLDGISSAKKILDERLETNDVFIQCKRCKSNAVDTEQKQTRSADEPMTIFCACRKCGQRWRIE